MCTCISKHSLYHHVQNITVAILLPKHWDPLSMEMNVLNISS
jgi:hypothetical protein